MALNSPLPAVYFPIKPETVSHPAISFSETSESPFALKCTPVANFRINKDFTTTSLTGNFTKQPLNLSKILFSNLLGTFLGSEYAITPLDQIKAHNEAVLTHQINSLQYREILIQDDLQHPTFVFLGVEGASILSDLLSTWLCPRISKGWKFYGILHQGVIYLWREADETYYHSHSPESFYLKYFCAVINGKDKLINAKNGHHGGKEYVLNRLELGGHKIFLAAEMEAISQKDGTVGVRLHREFSPTSIKRQQLSYWTEWVVNGWSGLIVGQRDYRGLLQDVQVFSEIHKDKLLNSSKLGGDECLKHQTAFLNWMDQHFAEVGRGIVQQFSWSPSDWLFADRVICSSLPPSNPTSKFPSWYEIIKESPIMQSDINNNEGDFENETKTLT